MENCNGQKEIEVLYILSQLRCYQRLQAIAEQAPALTSWLARQSERLLLKALSHESGQQPPDLDLWKCFELKTDQTQACDTA